MNELFVTAVTGLGGEANLVPLSKVRENADIVKYFQRTLMKPLWGEEVFATFFQSRPGEWEFDMKNRSVRLRSKLSDQIQEMMVKKRKGAAFPEKLYEALLRAGTLSDTVGAILNAAPADLAALPTDTVEALLDSLGKPLEPSDPLAGQPVFPAAQARVLAAVPGALEKKGASLDALMAFYKKVIGFGGDQPLDPKVAEQKIESLKELCEAAFLAIREKGLGGVSPGAIGLLCQTAPIHIIAVTIAGLGEKGEADDVKACAALLGKVPLPMLEALPIDTLLRLATACTKSGAVSETVLPIVAAASAATLSAWSADDVSKLLLAIVKAKVGTESHAVANLYGRAAEALFPKVEAMTDPQLIKVVLAFSKVVACKEFLEFVASEVIKRLSNLPLPQLLLLTQGLLPLGANNSSVSKLLDFWSESTDGAKVQLTGDQLAKLAQVVAPTSPSHSAFWNKIGKDLLEKSASLSDAGRASIQAAFPDGAGPDFPDKDSLLKALKPGKQKDADKEREREKDAKKRSRSRGRDRKRSRSRDERRDRRRSRSRDRDRRR